MQRSDLFDYIDGYLEIDGFKDYSPNGVQIEGGPEVERIALGVSISAALIDRAVDWNADAILVHHGMFWRGEPRTIRGFRRERIKRLLVNDITLAGYHLPLDAHMEVGNNIEIARALELEDTAPWGETSGRDIGVRGRFSTPVRADDIVARIEDVCGGDVIHFGADTGPSHLKTVGIVSGGGGKMIEQAIDAGFDLYLTGEPEEPAMAIADEAGLHFVAAGHYRTETFGVRALGAHLEDRFGLETRFFELPNPV